MFDANQYRVTMFQKNKLVLDLKRKHLLKI